MTDEHKCFKDYEDMENSLENADISELKNMLYDGELEKNYKTNWEKDGTYSQYELDYIEERISNT